MARLESFLRDTVWPRHGGVGWLSWAALQPAAALFGVGVGLRHAAYRFGLQHSARAPLPIVSIGSLLVGGSGKTPLTLWLAKQLRLQGLRVAIVMRGYGSRTKDVTIVSRGSGPEVDVDLAGDEATMLARGFDGVVIAAPQRLAGAVAAHELGCQVVLLDDGFQHRALARDFDLVLLTGQEGSMLPAGPQRDCTSALRRADAIAVVQKSPHDRVPHLPRNIADKPLFAVRFVPRSVIEPTAGVWQEQPLGILSRRRMAAVCGIARPGPFYEALHQWEVRLEECFEFPDHHRYTHADWQQIARDTRNVDWVITTEKDLVKLQEFPFARGKLLALRIEPEVENGAALVQLILERIGLATQANSSGPGRLA